MTYRDSRIVIACPKASGDGLFHLRWPQGNDPDFPAFLQANPAIDLSSAHGALSIGAGLAGQASDTSSASGSILIDPVLPTAVTNFQHTNQGGNNTSNDTTSNQHTTTITWGAAQPGTNPLSYYRIYRNGTAYATVTATSATTYSYTDSAATNLIAADLTGNDSGGYNFPATVYNYEVTAIDTAGGESPKASQQTYWIYQNGASAWGPDTQTWSFFNPTAGMDNFNDTTHPQSGHTKDWKVSFTSTNNYIQMAANWPGSAKWAFETGPFVNGFLVFDVYPTIANQTLRFNIISRVPPGDEFNHAQVTIGNNAGYGPSPMVQNAWNHYEIPMGKGTNSVPGLQMGTNTFQGYISGTTLTVTSVGSGVQLSPGGWAINAGMTGGYDYITAFGTGSGAAGTYTISTSQTLGSSGSPVSFTFQRTNGYKTSIFDLSGAATNSVYFDNMGYQTQAEVPGQMNVNSVLVGNGQVTIGYTLPQNTGGSPITGVTFLSTDGKYKVSNTLANPVIITGMTNGVAETFNAYVVNALGQSLPVTVGPVTPTASSTTAANLLAYLSALPTGSTNRLLIGQHVELFPPTTSQEGSTSFALTNWNSLKSATGKAPAIMGLILNTDLDLGIEDYALNTAANSTLFAQHTGAGGIVELSWYTPDPTNMTKNTGAISASNFTALITPGTSVYNNWQTIMASAVAKLKAAPFAGVPFIWRPFIELSDNQSGNNWYANQNSANFIKFWQLTYNYFKAAGLTNLLWNWNLNNYPPVSAGQYYPGDAYVDVVSSDPYPNPADTQAHIQSDVDFTFTTMMSYGKPAFFAEAGYTSNGSAGDNALFLATVKAHYPQVFGYVVWGGSYAIINQASASSLMSDSWITTLDELPAGLV